MLCSNCGHECSSGDLFCSTCGGKLDKKATPAQATAPASSFTIHDYYSNYGSPKAIRRQTILNRLAIATTSIHIFFSYLGAALGAVVLLGSASSLFSSYFAVFVVELTIVAVNCIGACVFSLLGVKKKSDGFLIASLPFAFFSIISSYVTISSFLPFLLLSPMESSLFSIVYTLTVLSPFVFLIVLIGILTMHVVMIVLNYKNIKEFKTYLASHSK